MYFHTLFFDAMKGTHTHVFLILFYAMQEKNKHFNEVLDVERQRLFYRGRCVVLAASVQCIFSNEAPLHNQSNINHLPHSLYYVSRELKDNETPHSIQLRKDWVITVVMRMKKP